MRTHRMTTASTILGAMAITVAVSSTSSTFSTGAGRVQTPQRGAQPASRAAASTPVRTVGDVLQIMHAIVIPASDGVFAAGGEAPKDDKGWTAVENQAIALAESGNLLMLGDRIKDRGDWLKMSRALVDAAATAVKAAQAKTADALSTASDAVYETCESCHATYLKK